MKANELEVLRQIIEEDPEVSDRDILEILRDRLSDIELYASKGDVMEQIILDVINQLKKESQGIVHVVGEVPRGSRRPSKPSVSRQRRKTP